MLQARPDDRLVLANRCAAFLGKCYGEPALRDAEACLRLHAAWPRGFELKGDALLLLCRVADAKAAYEEGGLCFCGRLVCVLAAFPWRCCSQVAVDVCDILLHRALALSPQRAAEKGCGWW